MCIRDRIYVGLKTLSKDRFQSKSKNDHFLLAVKERHFSTRGALLNIIKSTEEMSLGEQRDLNAMIQDYKSYKNSFVRNIKYDPNSYDLGKCFLP